MIGPLLGTTLTLVGVTAVGAYVFATVRPPRERTGSLALLIAGISLIALGLWLINQKS